MSMGFCVKLEVNNLTIFPLLILSSLCWWRWCNEVRSPAFLTLNLLTPDTRLLGAAFGGIPFWWLGRIWIWQVEGRVSSDLGNFCTCCIINGPPIKTRWSPDTLLQIRRQASKTDAIISFSIEAPLWFKSHVGRNWYNSEKDDGLHYWCCWKKKSI